MASEEREAEREAGFHLRSAAFTLSHSIYIYPCSDSVDSRVVTGARRWWRGARSEGRKGQCSYRRWRTSTSTVHGGDTPLDRERLGGGRQSLQPTAKRERWHGRTCSSFERTVERAREADPQTGYGSCEGPSSRIGGVQNRTVGRRCSSADRATQERAVGRPSTLSHAGHGRSVSAVR